MTGQLCLAILCFVLGVKTQNFDYYWRDYHGIIPEDALVGGRDINDNDVYIGQAYIHGHGLYVGQIIPGETEIAVPCYGVKKTNYLIKILCTKHKENFSWLKTNAATFQTDTIDRHAVIGGYDHVNNNGVLHVGRVMHQGMLKFGNIASYSVDTVWFYFPHKDKEQRSGSYQVLIYNKREP